MKELKSCSNCIKGTILAINNDIFCREKGIVTPNYVCSKHRYQFEQKSYKEQNYKCIHCELFVPTDSSSDIDTYTGLCQLFSVRSYDGRQKKACSKFEKKVKAVVI